jgi:hypothetical protein
MTIKYFKAKKQTHRFRENQKVWIRFEYANHLDIYFKWRGCGRYVAGVIDKFHGAVGDIKQIECDDNFFKRIQNLT